MKLEINEMIGIVSDAIQVCQGDEYFSSCVAISEVMSLADVEEYQQTNLFKLKREFAMREFNIHVGKEERWFDYQPDRVQFLKSFRSYLVRRDPNRYAPYDDLSHLCGKTISKNGFGNMIVLASDRKLVHTYFGSANSVDLRDSFVFSSDSFINSGIPVGRFIGPD